MRGKINLLFENIMSKPMKAPISLRKQLSRTITLCCVIAVSVQAIVMVAMIMNQYIIREKENTLYLLENDNVRIDNAFRYLEEIAISIQHDTRLKNFFDDTEYSEEETTEQLKSVTNFFSERNCLVGVKPFVEKIYLFNESGKSVCNLYYPVTISEREASGEIYYELYQNYKKSNENFYFQIESEYLNLCMKLYDTRMKTLGTCIFVLNKAGIEENYSNLEKMECFSWSICKGEEILLGKETFDVTNSANVLANKMSIGFGVNLFAAVSEWEIYRSLGTTVAAVLCISVFLIVLLSFWGHVVAIRYVRPLETVAEKIKLVGKGNFDTKLDEYSIEELQNISNTFNEMTEEIEHLVKEVYENRLIAQQAEIQYLQAQMNPHFLFNVLSMIKMKAAMNHDEEVQEMLYKLSALYQGKIFRKNEYFIYLKEEMEIVDFYLSLQKSRFGEKIDYIICYDGNKEDYQNLMVPRLSIEPIVENAVCHGLEPKEGKGRIIIKISKNDITLMVYIEDNGVGFEQEKMAEKREDRTHSHVGLWNTNKMIHNLCGKEYGLKIKSKIGQGTTIDVLLPIRNGETYVESNDC